MNIAMWSGPRNLSTAMMVSFAQREDCSVIDEPFYAAYLQTTGLNHPMRQEVINDGEVDHKLVIDHCTRAAPDGKSVFYQKHMTHHMIPEFDRQWMSEVTNVFLIRDPARVIASYNSKRENPSLSDIGIVEQLNLFKQVRDMTGEVPVVIDSMDILSNPELMLKKLCAALGLAFDHQMLSWEAGPKSFDGVWAKHWYRSVWESNGFGLPAEADVCVPEALQGLVEEAQEYFNELKVHSLPLK